MTSAMTRTRSADCIRPAFTLIEVLLALLVLSLLVGAVAVTVSGTLESRYLDEGAERLETALRMARAEAANRGRLFRLEVGQDGTCAISWEPGPLEEPGVFLPYTGSGWARALPNALVRVVECRQAGDEAYRPPQAATALSNVRGAREAVIDPVLFRPDGTCDSAMIELRSTYPQDLRRARIEMDGLHGLFTRRIMLPSELEERNAAR